MASKLLVLIIFFGGSVLFGLAAVASLRQRRAWGLNFPGDAATSPKVFWSFVTACTSVAVLAAGGGIAVAIQPIS
jgi:hypothetical protein